VKKSLDPPVFQRMEADNDQSPSGLEHVKRLRQHGVEFCKFLIDE
jgi:hypothetical protein